MRRWTVLALAALSGLAVGRAQDTPPTTTTAAPAATAPVAREGMQQTTVAGTIPDLSGRWLAVAHLTLGGTGHKRTSVALWEVLAKDGKPDLRTRFVALPPEVQGLIDAFNQKNESWSPRPEDLSTLATAWDTLEPKDSGVNLVETTITGRDGFDRTLAEEPKTKDAQWVVTQSMIYSPSAAPTIRQALVYSTLGAKDGGYTGHYASTVVAAAPFPIPIAFEGTFQLYRVEKAAPGIWRRLFDLFRGCGRS